MHKTKLHSSVYEVVLICQVHGHGDKNCWQKLLTKLLRSSFPTRMIFWKKVNLSGDNRLIPIIELLETECTCVCEMTKRSLLHLNVAVLSHAWPLHWSMKILGGWKLAWVVFIFPEMQCFFYLCECYEPWLNQGVTLNIDGRRIRGSKSES